MITFQQLKQYVIFCCLLAISQSLIAQTEIVSERTMYAKVYQRLDGKKEAVIYGEPAHYLDGNAWEPVSLAITNAPTGFENLTNPLKTYFPDAITGNSFLRWELPSGESIQIEALKRMVTYDNGNLSVLSNNPSAAVAVVNQTKVDYANIYPGISDGYEIAAGRVKNEVSLATLPSDLNTINSGYYGFKESFQLPTNFSVETASGLLSGLVNEDILIKNSIGETVLKIPAPSFMDAGGLGQAPDGSAMVAGSFLLEQHGGSITLSTLVPVAWLKDPARQYPVILDPTATLTGMDGGWMSTNNLVNNPNYAFVGVCCGNLMHRAWIRFNTSVIPDGSCVTNSELELFCNGVGGATAEQTWVNDVTGAHGPYPGINLTVYTDLGDGKYIDYQALGAGTTPFFSLGANANTDVQNSLTSNFYQLALMFQNEPSTNWKRYVATSCRMRVTYDAPGTCLLLPAELTDFSTVCNQYKTEINWTTSSETNLDYFVVEKSSDGLQFETLSQVPSAGNSNSTLQYNSADVNPFPGITYYRLKMVKIDGTVFYSDMRAINCGKELGTVTISPNPAHNSTQVEFVQHAAAHVEIILMNNLGRVLEQVAVSAKAGINQYTLDLSEYPRGIYLLTIKDGGQQAIRKIIKE